MPAPWEGLLWGTLPMGSSFLAMALVLLLRGRGRLPSRLKLRRECKSTTWPRKSDEVLDTHHHFGCDRRVGRFRNARADPSWSHYRHHLRHGFAGTLRGCGHTGASVGKLLNQIQKREWRAAYSELANKADVDEALFTRDLTGNNGSLRTLSGLESWELEPLHATNQEAEVRSTLRWSTAVGPLRDVKDLKVVRQNDAWRWCGRCRNFPISRPRLSR